MGGKRKEYLPYLDENVIVIDPGIDEELSNRSKDELCNDLPEDHKGKCEGYFNFIHNMQKGDYVFARTKKEAKKPPVGRLGKIIGAYEYDRKNRVHKRRVVWLTEEGQDVAVDTLGIKRVFGTGKDKVLLLHQLVEDPNHIDMDTWNQVVGKLEEKTLSEYQWLEALSVVEEIWRALRALKQQVVLYGPPGTSKTFNAMAVVAYVLGCSFKALDNYRLFHHQDGSPSNKAPRGGWEFIQFHSEYGYEDFVVGIVPKAGQEGGALTFEVQPRLFVQMARRADEDREHPYFLVIDEFNRASLDRTIGELLFALEYRNQRVYVPLLKDYLVVPDNLYIIATMNSADKNIGDLDHALRRRFLFYKLKPNPNLLKEVLRKGLGSELADELVSLFVNLNEIFEEKLKKPDFAVGHTYFFPAESFIKEAKEHLRMRLKFEVKPLLEEYQSEGILYGQYFDEAMNVVKKMEEILK
ncbi:MAG: AAA family ATPase [Candidatus Bathyarchaeia archaeon]